MFTFIRTVVFALGVLMPLAQKAIIPFPLLLQRSLVTSTYAHGIWSFAQKYNWLPKSISLKNRLVKKTKKDIKKTAIALESGLMDMLNFDQRKAFFDQRNMCIKYNFAQAKIAERNSIQLRLLALTLSHSIVMPFMSYNR